MYWAKAVVLALAVVVAVGGGARLGGVAWRRRWSACTHTNEKASIPEVPADLMTGLGYGGVGGGDNCGTTLKSKAESHKVHSLPCWGKVKHVNMFSG